MLDWLRAQLDGDPGFTEVLDRLRRAVPRAVVDHDRFESLGLAGPALWEQAVHEAIADADVRLRGALPAAA